MIISLQVAVDDAIDGHLFHLHLHGNAVITIEIVNIETHIALISGLIKRFSFLLKPLTIDVKRPGIK